MTGMAKAACFLAVLTAALPSMAQAHAILLESTPAAQATLPSGPIQVRLRFNSRIDAARSRVALWCGGPETVLPLAPPEQPGVLAASAALTAGACVLRWQVLSVDGHITRGSVNFTATSPAGN